MTTYELTEYLREKLLNMEGIKKSVKDNSIQNEILEIQMKISDLMDRIYSLEEENTEI